MLFNNVMSDLVEAFRRRDRFSTSNELTLKNSCLVGNYSFYYVIKDKFENCLLTIQNTIYLYSKTLKKQESIYMTCINILYMTCALYMF